MSDFSRFTLYQMSGSQEKKTSEEKPSEVDGMSKEPV